MNVHRIALPALLLALLCTACDRTPARVTVPSTAPAAPTLELELKPVTPLVSGRPTHVAVDPLGNIYWVQESPDRGDDTLFVIGDGEIPRATQLSAGLISQAMGAPEGRGNIQGVASGPAGEIYFYFCGAQARRTIAAVGRFFPKTAKVQILADVDAIASATGMGRSLTLARGSVVSDGRSVWVWIRHSDAWAVFRLDPGKLPADGGVSLRKAFDSIRLRDQSIELTREELDISAGPGDGSLMLVDPPIGKLLRIDPTGSATVIRSIVGLPDELSTPTTDRTGKMLLFAGANADPIKPTSADEAESIKPPDVSYPAMLIFDGDHTVTIDQNHILAYPGFLILKLRLKQLLPNASQQEWISYDDGSGELLRLRIHERLWQ